eukprot:COSAG06_NODE_4552_length_4154_cov_41.030567_5_plen_94_part_00
MKVAGCGPDQTFRPDHGPDVVVPLVVTSCSPTACCNTYWGDTSRLGGGVAPLAPAAAAAAAAWKLRHDRESMICRGGRSEAKAADTTQLADRS